MKLTISKKTLLDSLGVVVPVTDMVNSHSRSVFSNFLLKTGSTQKNNSSENQATDKNSSSKDMKELVITAVNDEMSIITTTGALVKSAGEICVNANKVFRACGYFTGDEIGIELDNKKNVIFSSKKARVRASSMDTSLYPTFDKIETSASFSISSSELRRCIDLTLFAVREDEPRKNLRGVCFRLIGDDKSKWVATDGHRLSIITVPVENIVGEDQPEVIIPRQTIAEIRKILKDEDEEVQISFGERYFKVIYKSTVITSLLVEGNFPDIEKVIPKDNDKKAVINIQSLDNALNYTEAVSGDKLSTAKLNFSKGLLKVESEESETFYAQDEMEAEFEGEPFEIGFNTRYLKDLFKVLPGEQVKMEFKGPLSPCLIKSENLENFISVVMPLRLEW